MNRRIWFLLACAAAFATGCDFASHPTGSASAAQRCASNADCASDQICSPHDAGAGICARANAGDPQHGGAAGSNAVAAASCTSDADCANGDECEHEQSSTGAGFCKPHHDDKDEHEADAGEDDRDCVNHSGPGRCGDGERGRDEDRDGGVTDDDDGREHACADDAGAEHGGDCGHGDGHGGDGHDGSGSGDGHGGDGSDGSGDHGSDGRH